MNAAERRIRAYEAMGWHRTGWEADDRAADWLITELQAAGVAAREQRFRAPRWRWNHPELQSGPWSIPGEPISDGTMTGPAGVSGAIGEEIVIWERGADDAARMAAGVYDELAKLAEAGARAVVMVMGDEHGDPVLRNAERPWNPIELPVLQIAPRDMVDFEPGTEAIVRIEGSREEVQARNVVAEIPGADPDAAPVTLMTPKSGWFTCAAERGGGIAVWLEVAARVATNPGRRTLNFVASSGHELHHLGLEHYISELGPSRRPRPHLDAPGSLDRLPQRPTRLRRLRRRTLQRRHQRPLRPPARSAEPSRSASAGFGEARNIGEIGGRFVSFLGGHPYFHSPSDTYDRCIDPESLAKHTDAVERIVRYMLQ